MRVNNGMNNSSLACKGRARKASEVRDNGKIFGPKMFGLPLYLRNAAPSTPIKRGKKWPSIRNAQENAKEKEG